MTVKRYQAHDLRLCVEGDDENRAITYEAESLLNDLLLEIDIRCCYLNLEVDNDEKIFPILKGLNQSYLALRTEKGNCIWRKQIKDISIDLDADSKAIDYTIDKSLGILVTFTVCPVAE